MSATKASTALIVRSINEIIKNKGKAITGIVLSASDDLVCRNMMCEKLLQPCVCRLEHVLHQFVSHPMHVDTLDLSNNKLEFSPPAITKFSMLTTINLSKNKFPTVEKIPWDEIVKISSLKCIDLSDNDPKLHFDDSFFRKYPSLRQIIRS